MAWLIERGTRGISGTHGKPTMTFRVFRYFRVFRVFHDLLIASNADCRPVSEAYGETKTRSITKERRRKLRCFASLFNKAAIAGCQFKTQPLGLADLNGPSE